MSRKTFEMSFQISGKMASSFKGSFSSAASQIHRLSNDVHTLRNNLVDLTHQYRKGQVSAEHFIQEHKRLSTQLDQTTKAHKRLKSELRSQISANVTNGLRAGIGWAGQKGMMLAGGGLAAAGIASTAVLGVSLNKAIAYEAQLSSIQALTNLNNQEMKEMNSLALQMGAKTKYSALQSAQGIEELLKAGLTPAMVKAGGLEAALNLATAGELELAEAAEIMSDSLNGFKRSNMSAADAANILAGAASASSTDVRKIKEGISQVGPIADGLNASFKGVNATLAVFSNNALKGSDAGTSLKTFLANIQPETEEAEKLFKKFNLTTKNGTNIFFDANGHLKDMADVAEILKKNFGKLNDQQRTKAFFDIFGSDAVRAATILYKEGADGIKKMYQEMARVTALDVAKKKMDNAAGALEQLSGAIETLQITALTPTLPLIKQFALGAADYVGRHSEQITKSVQNAVNNARAYLNSHFIKNPEFRNLPDIKSRIRFVIDDFLASFNGWLANGGQQQISEVGGTTINILAGVIEAGAPRLAEAGGRIGIAMAGAILDGAKKTLEDSYLGSVILGALAGGAVAGPAGAFYAGLTATGAWAGNKIMKTWDPLGKYSMPQGPNGKPMALPAHATGGFFSSPHVGLVAEAGREAIIPMDGSPRAKSLWERAGNELGVRGSGDTYVNFAPVINGAGPEIIPALRQERKSLIEELKALKHQERRVSYA